MAKAKKSKARKRRPGNGKGVSRRGRFGSSTTRRSTQTNGLTLEQQLALHDQSAPEAGSSGAYGDAYKRQWRRERAALTDAIWRRDAKRATGAELVEVSVDDPEATRKARQNHTQCLRSEAWRHNRLTGMQQDASKEMEFAVRARTVGTGAAVSKYTPLGGPGAARGDISAATDKTWRDWAEMAPKRRIMVAVVIDCLVEPKTLGQVERDHRMRRGQAMEQFALGLDLWCELRGWIRGPRPGIGPHLAPEGVTT